MEVACRGGEEKDDNETILPGVGKVQGWKGQMEDIGGKVKAMWKSLDCLDAVTTPAVYLSSLHSPSNPTATTVNHAGYV